MLSRPPSATDRQPNRDQQGALHRMSLHWFDCLAPILGFTDFFPFKQCNMDILILAHPEFPEH